MTRLEHTGRDPDSGRHTWRLHLLDVEAAILRGLPEQLRTLLGHPDANRAVIDRLFPTSYADPDQEREHRKLLGQGLLEERRELLDAVDAELAGGEELDDGLALELDAGRIDLWLRFVNDVRLVIATDLGLEAEDMEPDAQPPSDPKRALLEYLGGLEAILVEAVRREF